MYKSNTPIRVPPSPRRGKGINLEGLRNIAADSYVTSYEEDAKQAVEDSKNAVIKAAVDMPIGVLPNIPKSQKHKHGYGPAATLLGDENRKRIKNDYAFLMASVMDGYSAQNNLGADLSTAEMENNVQRFTQLMEQRGIAAAGDPETELYASQLLYNGQIKIAQANEKAKNEKYRLSNISTNTITIMRAASEGDIFAAEEVADSAELLVGLNRDNGAMSAKLMGDVYVQSLFDETKLQNAWEKALETHKNNPKKAYEALQAQAKKAQQLFNRNKRFYNDSSFEKRYMDAMARTRFRHKLAEENGIIQRRVAAADEFIAANANNPVKVQEYLEKDRDNLQIEIQALVEELGNSGVNVNRKRMMTWGNEYVSSYYAPRIRKAAREAAGARQNARKGMEDAKKQVRLDIKAFKDSLLNNKFEAENDPSPDAEGVYNLGQMTPEQAKKYRQLKVLADYFEIPFDMEESVRPITEMAEYTDAEWSAIGSVMGEVYANALATGINYTAEELTEEALLDERLKFIKPEHARFIHAWGQLHAQSIIDGKEKFGKDTKPQVDAMRESLGKYTDLMRSVFANGDLEKLQFEFKDKDGNPILPAEQLRKLQSDVMRTTGEKLEFTEEEEFMLQFRENEEYNNPQFLAGLRSSLFKIINDYPDFNSQQVLGRYYRDGTIPVEHREMFNSVFTGVVENMQQYKTTNEVEWNLRSNGHEQVIPYDHPPAEKAQSNADRVLAISENYKAWRQQELRARNAAVGNKWGLTEEDILSMKESRNELAEIGATQSPVYRDIVFDLANSGGDPMSMLAIINPEFRQLATPTRQSELQAARIVAGFRSNMNKQTRSFWRGILASDLVDEDKNAGENVVNNARQRYAIADSDIPAPHVNYSLNPGSFFGAEVEEYDTVRPIQTHLEVAELMLYQGNAGYLDGNGNFVGINEQDPQLAMAFATVLGNVPPEAEDGVVDERHRRRITNLFKFKGFSKEGEFIYEFNNAYEDDMGNNRMFQIRIPTNFNSELYEKRNDMTLPARKGDDDEKQYGTTRGFE